MKKFLERDIDSADCGTRWEEFLTGEELTLRKRSLLLARNSLTVNLMGKFQTGFLPW